MAVDMTTNALQVMTMGNTGPRAFQDSVITIRLLWFLDAIIFSIYTCLWGLLLEKSV